MKMDIKQDEGAKSKWQMQDLEDICVEKGLVRGPFGGALKKEFFVSKGYKVYEQRNAIYQDATIGEYYIDDKKFQELKRFEVEEGDFIVSCSGTIGKIYRIPRNAPKGVINQALLKITIDYKKVDSEFFYQYFQWESFQKRIIDNTQGGAMQNLVGMAVFRKTKLKIPTVSEQQKIASILSTWDKAIELKEKLIEQKKEQKKGLMQKLLTGEVRLPGFTDQWKEVKLGEIGKTYNGLSGKTAEDFGTGKPYIPYKTIFDDSKIDLKKVDFVQLEKGEKQNSAKKGDIFFTTSSETPKEVGMSSVLLEDIDEIYLNSFCFGYRLNNFKDLSPNFARYYFRSDEFRKKTYALAQGSTRFNISKNEVMKIVIQVPTIDEQKAIATVLSNNDEEIKLLQEQVNSIKQQKKGLMQLLLTGKVRVKV
ncbi:restriction endonuclease subunit S [Bacillus licheniformis]|uniref:restriction endonuclease subunit S n=1 Tax=Bacillus licheniformis TaxID=1402 RepID=UPI0011A40D1A|nr:restriction endonuclease subunit S [Bacillus licheniformis]MBA1160320.1 restriction endonuclease subunit S [Bacillus licheniformis]TWN41164.1 hypothetical protein CHCC14525_2485 [Bacillus licheniformis]